MILFHYCYINYRKDTSISEKYRSDWLMGENKQLLTIWEFRSCRACSQDVRFYGDIHKANKKKESRREFMFWDSMYSNLFIIHDIRHTYCFTGSNIQLYLLKKKRCTFFGTSINQLCSDSITLIPVHLEQSNKTKS